MSAEGQNCATVTESPKFHKVVIHDEASYILESDAQPRLVLRDDGREASLTAYFEVPATIALADEWEYADGLFDDLLGEMHLQDTWEIDQLGDCSEEVCVLDAVPDGPIDMVTYNNGLRTVANVTLVRKPPPPPPSPRDDSPCKVYLHCPPCVGVFHVRMKRSDTVLDLMEAIMRDPHMTKETDVTVANMTLRLQGSALSRCQTIKQSGADGGTPLLIGDN